MSATKDPHAALSAWRAEPGSKRAFQAFLDSLGPSTPVATFLDSLGVFQQHGTVDADLLAQVGIKAFERDALDIARRFFERALTENRHQVVAYSGLIHIFYRQENANAAIAVFKRAIANGALHSRLLSDMSHVYGRLLGDTAKGRRYSELAHQTDANNVAAMDNLARMYAGRDPEFADQLYTQALARSPEDAQLNMNYALFLLQAGELARGWRHYRYRMDLSLGPRKALRYNPILPGWDGEDLTGKAVFAMAEQGLGDELLFGLTYPALYARARHLTIGCDRRLIPIFQRSFPDATVTGFRDTVVNRVRDRSFPYVEAGVQAGTLALDHALPIGDLGRAFWPDRAAVGQWPCGYIKADPERTAEMAARMGPRREPVRIGLAWRSGTVDVDRKHGYLDPDDLAPILAVPGVEFVVLQYSLAEGELAHLRRVARQPVIALDDVDLKDDLDANLAIMENVDMVMSPPMAPAMMSICLGRPTWLLAGMPWWFFGERSEWPAHVPVLRWLRFNRRHGVPELGPVVEAVRQLAADGPDGAWGPNRAAAD
ncbi:hypothetical protein CCR85_06805 [Rhodothalassium salexigens]|uniref:tetratricopeptide repeat protein n=1 Tax=Rhodothalassium salexigens TaxID=1086 RepID=UPI0019143C0A|nr:hypothetical protein [Rhodothalassium salexigens]MBK5911201.1 hypothetical protein [Rhodothalassium salexigens]MBK5919889.1 hypothetical protein [Rhodothalassium salexigens]